MTKELNRRLFLSSGAAAGVAALAGDGTFQAPVNYLVVSRPNSIATADFNGDGAVDLALGSAFGGVTVLLNVGGASKGADH